MEHVTSGIVNRMISAELISESEADYLLYADKAVMQKQSIASVYRDR